jgi:hypothetical protein
MIIYIKMLCDIIENGKISAYYLEKNTTLNGTITAQNAPTQYSNDFFIYPQTDNYAFTSQQIFTLPKLLNDNNAYKIEISLHGIIEGTNSGNARFNVALKHNNVLYFGTNTIEYEDGSVSSYDATYLNIGGNQKYTLKFFDFIDNITTQDPVELLLFVRTQNACGSDNGTPYKPLFNMSYSLIPIKI